MLYLSMASVAAQDLGQQTASEVVIYAQRTNVNGLLLHFFTLVWEMLARPIAAWK